MRYPIEVDDLIEYDLENQNVEIIGHNKAKNKREVVLQILKKD